MNSKCFNVLIYKKSSLKSSNISIPIQHLKLYTPLDKDIPIIICIIFVLFLPKISSKMKLKSQTARN